MGEFDQLVVDRIRAGLMARPGGVHASVALGLWCPICGADTNPDERHKCSPAPAKEMCGVLEAL